MCHGPARLGSNLRARKGRKLTNRGQAARRKRTEMGDTPFSLATANNPPPPRTRHHKHHRGPASPKRRLSWSPACSPENEPAGPTPATPHGLGVGSKTEGVLGQFLSGPPHPHTPKADQQSWVSNESSSGSFHNLHCRNTCFRSFFETSD